MRQRLKISLPSESFLSQVTRINSFNYISHSSCDTSNTPSPHTEAAAIAFQGQYAQQYPTVQERLQGFYFTNIFVMVANIIREKLLWFLVPY